MSTFRPEVGRALPWLVLQRFIGNVGVRYAYTFLPALARGTGFSVQEVSVILSGRDLTALASPAIGRLSDRTGSGQVLTLATVVSAIGMLVTSIGSTGFAVGMLVFGLGKIGFDVTMNAWIADEVAYERRGRVSGLIEVSWAAAALVGLPLCGVLIDRVGWWSASLVLGLGSLPLAFATHRTAQSHHHHERERVRPTFSPSVVAALIGLFALTGASQLLVVSHGLWLEDSYGFDAAEVGFAIVTVGVIEAIASFGSSAYVDRLGKKTAVIMGSALMAICVGGLAIAPSPPLVVGLVLLAGAFLGFEFGFVSYLPLVSELDPKARAEMIGIALGASTVVRAVGSVFGAWWYGRVGFDSLMTITAGLLILLIVLGLVAIDEPVTPSPAPDVVQ